MKTYQQVHAGLFYERGNATDYPCVGCGDNEKNHQWAYQHNAGEAELLDGFRPYSEELYAHYAPMCRPCHNLLDGPRDGRYTKSREAMLRRAAADPEYATRLREQVAEFGRKGREAIERRRREDPAFAQRMKGNLRDARAKAMADPDFATKSRAALELAWAACREKADDPEYKAKQSANGKRSALKRRRCGECNMIAAPGPLGSHQRKTSHKGYEDLK